MATVDDYYKDLAARPKPNYDRNPNFQIKQSPLDLSPADGSEGFVGSNTGDVSGLKVISGKQGYSEDRPIWSETSSFKASDKDNTGTGDEGISPGGTDSRDEKADWKHPRNDDGMIQTYRDSVGAGDAGPADDAEGSPSEENTQSVPSADAGDHDMDMPQTEFTHNDGGGAPKFSHRG